MKGTNVLLVLFVITAIILGWLYFNTKTEFENCENKLAVCHQDLESCKEDCACEKDEQRILKEPNIDYSLKVDCAESKNNIFQVFQYDLANGYSILGKLKLNEENSQMIDSVHFKLYEAGSCKRYGIKKVTKEIVKGKQFFMIHIEAWQEDDSENLKYVNNIKIDSIKYFYPKIVSKGFPRLNTRLRPDSSSKELDGIESTAQHFPPFICPIQIYDGTNQ